MADDFQPFGAGKIGEAIGVAEVPLVLAGWIFCGFMQFSGVRIWKCCRIKAASSGLLHDPLADPDADLKRSPAASFNER